MRVIRLKCFPPKGFIVLNFFGIFILRKGHNLTGRVINHENIHTAQMKELLYVPFYILYLLEWVVRLVQYRNFDTAYKNISFEKEAFTNERNFKYLPKREKYSFLKYTVK